ncbi:MAG: hypothetical protein E7B50_06940 [Negativicoccus succinicivorans]|nr:hypothetical protein [Negativicoccus succinicivorans]
MAQRQDHAAMHAKKSIISENGQHEKEIKMMTHRIYLLSPVSGRVRSNQ